MIGFLFGWMMEHLLLSGVIGLLSVAGIAGGVKAVRRHQKKRDKARFADITRSRKMTKAAKPKTARQILREKRSEQPLGVVVRKRAPGDERLLRRAVNRVKVRRANAKAAAPEKPRILELAAQKIVTAGPKVGKTPMTPLVGRCNRPTRDGSLCRRRVTAGRDCGANHEAA